jgi:hypothetical protein
MSIKFACERCGQQIEVADHFRGKRGSCKHCGQPMRVPKTVPGELEDNVPASSPEPVAAAAAGEGGLKLRPIDSTEPERVDARLLDRGAPLQVKPAQEAPRSKPAAISDPDQPAETNTGRWRALLTEPRSIVYKLAEPLRAPRTDSSAGPPPAVMLIPSQIARVLSHFFLKIRNWLYVASVVGLLIALYGYLFSWMNMLHIGATIVIAANISMLVVGVVYLVSLPFKESFHHGLANVLIPFYAIYYWSTRWQKMKRPVVNTLGSFLPIFLVAIAYIVFEEREPIEHALENPASIKESVKDGAERVKEELQQGADRVKEEFGPRLKKGDSSPGEAATEPEPGPEAKPEPEPNAKPEPGPGPKPDAGSQPAPAQPF